jgi:hypothetical protein
MSIFLPIDMELMGMVKLIKVKDETHKELAKLGNYGDTMDDIITKCIQAYKKMEKQK